MSEQLARELLDRAARAQSRFLLFMIASVFLDVAAVGAYLVMKNPLALIGMVPGTLLVALGVMQMQQAKMLRNEAKRVRAEGAGLTQSVIGSRARARLRSLRKVSIMPMPQTINSGAPMKR